MNQDDFPTQSSPNYINRVNSRSEVKTKITLQAWAKQDGMTIRSFRTYNLVPYLQYRSLQCTSWIICQDFVGNYSGSSVKLGPTALQYDSSCKLYSSFPLYYDLLGDRVNQSHTSWDRFYLEPQSPGIDSSEEDRFFPLWYSPNPRFTSVHQGGCGCSGAQPEEARIRRCEHSARMFRAIYWYKYHFPALQWTWLKVLRR